MMPRLTLEYVEPRITDLTRLQRCDERLVIDQIATRRLLHMARVFCALGSVESALTHTLSRFDADTANGFKNLWNAIHENPNANPSPSGEAVAVEPTTEQAPF